MTEPRRAAGAGNVGDHLAHRGWRDPWLFAAALAPLVLLALLAGGRPGEPVADDYDYLHHILLSGSWSWLDGCGSLLYWRPLARQAYYAALAPLMLSHPYALALVHAGALGLTAVLLYRAFRPALGPVAAFAISTAPWMMESARLLIAWPSCFQDLGALLFISLALHEAVAGRRWSFLASGMAALLCKEVAAIALISLVICPVVPLDRGPGRPRRTWLAALAVLIAAWGMVYLWVYARASLVVPGHEGGPGSALGLIPAAASVAWWSWKAIWSLPPATVPVDLVVVMGLIAITPWPRVIAVLRSGGGELRSWWVWGLAWSVPLSFTLVPLVRAWVPYRLPLVGFGALVAIMVTLRAVHRNALLVFLGLRLVALALAPRPEREVAGEAPFRGATIDVPRLSRLQHFVADVRDELRARFPRLHHGAVVVREGFPAMTEYGFGVRPALHVWYRDTTLRWVPISEWMADPSMRPVTVVEYQDDRRDEVALVDPEAMRAMILATAAMNAGREAESLRWLARAESLQVDTTAVTFRRSLAGKRAYATARMRFEEGRYAEARSALLALLALFPRDVPGRRMLEQVEGALGPGAATDSAKGARLPTDGGRH